MAPEDSLEKVGAEAGCECEGGDASEGHPQRQQDPVPHHHQHVGQHLQREFCSFDVFSCNESLVSRHVLFSEDLSHLLHDDVAGEQKGDCDSNHKEDVVPALLGAPGEDGNVVMEFLKETPTCP